MTLSSWCRYWLSVGLQLDESNWSGLLSTTQHAKHFWTVYPYLRELFNMPSHISILGLWSLARVQHKQSAWHCCLPMRMKSRPEDLIGNCLNCVYTLHKRFVSSSAACLRTELSHACLSCDGFHIEFYGESHLILMSVSCIIHQWLFPKGGLS